MGDEVWVLIRMSGSKGRNKNKGMEKIVYLILSFKICIIHQIYEILGSRRIRLERKTRIMSNLYL
jgi:hypothetical protein